jgi:hypothetical protein
LSFIEFGTWWCDCSVIRKRTSDTSWAGRRRGWLGHKFRGLENSGRSEKLDLPQGLVPNSQCPFGGGESTLNGGGSPPPKTQLRPQHWAR